MIHTHQPYATALGLTAPGDLQLTAEERAALGGVAWAEYGLPGTKKLKNAVAAALETGAHTVLMRHHGALICGTDQDDALRRAMLLETVCRRSWRCGVPIPARQEAAELPGRVRELFPDAVIEDGDAARAWSALKRPLRAQLDDAAQMIGAQIPVAKDARELQVLLWNYAAVFVPGMGAVVCGETADDTAALKVLTDKAAIAALHTRALKSDAVLSRFDCALMRQVYRLKYSKKKDG